MDGKPAALRAAAALGGLSVVAYGCVWLIEPLKALHLNLAIFLIVTGLVISKVNIFPDRSRGTLETLPFLGSYLGCVVFYAGLGLLNVSSGEFVPRFGLISFVSGFYLLLLSAANGICLYLA